jgi:cholesterol oxidase
MNKTIYDYIVIGSGFGGSVSAMRLSEKGYNVLVIEKGKKYEQKDFPKTNWSINKFFWFPIIKCFGIQQLSFFKNVFILSGVGVGGGSLVYANTQMVPGDAFFENKSWSHIKNWKETLLPFYEKAKFMLGTVKQPLHYREDEVLKEVAQDMNRIDSFGGVNVGVYFGDKKNAIDPYFKGLGPQRTGCTECAGCMVGCRYNAKNSLDKNYLYFAQKNGVEILAEREVISFKYVNDVYEITTECSTSWFRKDRKVFYSKGLVMAGGVLGTMGLLLKEKYETKNLANLSDKLGESLRTNSESLCGIALADGKLNHGVAISSIFNPDDHTHIEIVKYSNGSGVMGKLATLATDGNKPFLRTLKWILNLIIHPIQTIRTFFDFGFADNAIILLVMQSLDNSMKMIWKKSFFGGSIAIKNLSNDKVPAYIGIGQEVMRHYAKKVNGTPMNAITEVALNMSTTAHIIGGCPMGKTKEEGVVDEYFRAFGYNNMYIVDGSIIPSNLGVNPSLSITALAEYAMHHVPEKEGNSMMSLEEQIERM